MVIKTDFAKDKGSRFLFYFFGTLIQDRWGLDFYLQMAQSNLELHDNDLILKSISRSYFDFRYSVL